MRERKRQKEGGERKCQKNERKVFSQGKTENDSSSRGEEGEIDTEVRERERAGDRERLCFLFVISELNVDLVLFFCGLTSNHTLLICLLPHLTPYIFSSFHPFLISSFPRSHPPDFPAMFPIYFHPPPSTCPSFPPPFSSSLSSYLSHLILPSVSHHPAEIHWD